jgi:hypothetical protein
MKFIFCSLEKSVLPKTKLGENAFPSFISVLMGRLLRFLVPKVYGLLTGGRGM